LEDVLELKGHDGKEVELEETSVNPTKKVGEGVTCWVRIVRELAG